MAQPANSLLLAGNTLIENSSCGAGGSDLWCWVKGKTMAECLDLFDDPEKTSEIIAGYTTSRIRYTGYTRMILIKRNPDTIDVRLTWPEGGEHSITELPVEAPEMEEDDNE